jgi:hypothetical protein
MIRTSTITAHPNSLILSSVLLTEDGNTYQRHNSNIQTRKISNVSKLSPQALRKVKKAITYMAHLAPTKKIYNPKFSSKFNFKLAFITLTLSSRQQHTDQEIKDKILHPFIDYCQKVYKVKNYVWKSERQKNGNIHFHMVIDKYISYEVIRRKWNEYQDRLQYISNYWGNIEERKAMYTDLDSYYTVNSTDIHSVRKIHDLQRYLIKYMIKPNSTNRLRVKRNHTHLTKKNYDNYKFLSHNTKTFLKTCAGNGRIWGCSHGLSNITGARDFLCNDFEEEVIRLKADKEVYIKDESYFLYLGFDYKVLERLRCKHIIQFLADYLYSEFGYNSMSVI